MSDMLKDITICPMQEKDLDQVIQIENASYPCPWARIHFLDELNAKYNFPLVALDISGRLVGYICPMLLLDEGHIFNVAVHPLFRGKGIGKILVNRVIEECRISGAEFITLEVRISNQSALSLYRSIGFTECGHRIRYYENGEDALLMEYRITEQEGNHEF